MTTIKTEKQGNMTIMTNLIRLPLDTEDDWACDWYDENLSDEINDYFADDTSPRYTEKEKIFEKNFIYIG